MLTKIKKNMIFLTFILIFIYFLFNILGGDRGLISFYEKKKILSDLKDKNNKILENIAYLEARNMLLKSSIDIDLVEILIRDKFAFGKKGEKIYIIKLNEN